MLEALSASVVSSSLIVGGGYIFDCCWRCSFCFWFSLAVAREALFFVAGGGFIFIRYQCCRFRLCLSSSVMAVASFIVGLWWLCLCSSSTRLGQSTLFMWVLQSSGGIEFIACYVLSTQLLLYCFTSVWIVVLVSSLASFHFILMVEGSIGFGW